MTQGNFEVRAVLNFDLSSITAITGARLEFTAYSLNDTGNFTVGRVVGELTSGEFLAEADINMSSTIDFLDISPFIGLLSTGG